MNNNLLYCTEQFKQAELLRYQTQKEEFFMEIKWKSCVKLGVTVMILFLLMHYWATFSGLAHIAFGAALPLLLGCAIAYIVNILMSFFERRIDSISHTGAIQKIRRPLCMALAFISILFIAVLIVWMIVPELIRCLQILLKELPAALNAAYQWLEENLPVSALLQSKDTLLFGSEMDWQKNLAKLMDILLNGLGGAMGVAASVVSSLLSTVVTAMAAFIFSIYLLAGKEKISGQLKRLFARYLPPKLTNGIYYVAKTLDHSFHSFIVGQCTEAVVLGLLCMIGMLLLRLPYAAMIGCLIGFTALIPVAGAYIGAVVGAFMIFTVSWVQALIFLVFLSILQQLEGNLIYPRIVGSSIGLPGIWVLAAVTVGGGVMGIAGMFLGVPLAATVYQLLKHDICRKS